MEAGALLWLDLGEVGEETLSLLREVFRIHPLAAEDVKEFHQRPKIEDYDGSVSLVAYGAGELGDPLVEVHRYGGDTCGKCGTWDRRFHRAGASR